MKKILIGVVLLVLLGLGIYGVYTTYFESAPKPYEEFAQQLEAEYGWEIVDVEVNTAMRVVIVAGIPPEDEQQYMDSIFCIFEWAHPLIKPPLTEDGSLPLGVGPGTLIIVELTEECYVLAPPVRIQLFSRELTLCPARVVPTYGYELVMGANWFALDWFLGEKDGVPIRVRYRVRADLYTTLFQMQFFGMGGVGGSSEPIPYEPLQDGWYQVPEKEEPKA